jgi:hypothetical protein
MNTLENKERFFAQYWDQNILCDGQRANYFVSDYFENLMSAACWLLLTPLSAITDEDAMSCGFRINDDEEDYLYGMSARNVFSYDYRCYGDFMLGICLIDHLRSKGYALPWMGISVEDQIEYGWIKLTN